MKRCCVCKKLTNKGVTSLHDYVIQPYCDVHLERFVGYCIRDKVDYEIVEYPLHVETIQEIIARMKKNGTL